MKLKQRNPWRRGDDRDMSSSHLDEAYDPTDLPGIHLGSGAG